MNLKTMLGQKFVVGFLGTELTDEFREAVKKYHFANIILFRRNLENPQQIRKLCQDLYDLILEETGEIPLISIDQEGGMVARLADDQLNIPGAMALSASSDDDLLSEMNYLNAKVLLDLGINFNLAPVLDINTEADNPVIGIRSYSDRAEEVARLGVKAIEASQRAGVLAAAKHFPGHGDTKVDSHIGLPSIAHPLDFLEKRELYPFKVAIDNGVAAIMTTHILFPELEPEKIPATMSRRILTDLLRNEFGFKGLIVSDCMEMKAISTHYGTSNGVIKAFEAGVDMVFVSHTLDVQIEAYEKAYEAYENGDLSIEEMEASVNRILKSKEKLQANVTKQELSTEEYNKFIADIDAAVSKTFVALPDVNKFKATFNKDTNLQDTVIIGPAPFRSTNVSNEEMGELSFAKNLGELLNLDYIESSGQIEADEIAELVEKAKDYKQIILGLYNAHIITEQLELCAALKKLDLPILLVALGSPYDLMYLDSDDLALACFEYTYKSIRHLANCLLGKELPLAKLPVKLEKRSL